MKCIEDEIPFELPQGWEWCRLGIVFSHNTGKALNKSNTNGKLLSYITTSNVYWDRFELDNLKNMHFTDTELEKCTVKKGDLLVCEGGDIGRAAIWNYDYDICIQNHIHRLRPYANVNIVLYYHIFYYYKLIGMINGKGIGIQGLSSNQLHSIPIPLPPLQEQHRIVIKLKELISFIDTIESDKADLQSTIQLTKSKILGLAIRGKLVPQDPNDEPASVLLERIRTEKEELIKQGKIKRDKKESVIFRGDDNSYYEVIGSETANIDEEIPFNLPDKWEWVRLGVLFSHNTGKTLNKKDTTGIKMTYITTSNLYWNRFELNSLKEMNFNESEIEKYTVQKGDLLVCEGGDIGRAAIWNYDYEMRIQNHIHKLHPYTDVSVLLYYYVFYYYKLTDRISGKGIGIQGLSSNQLHNIFLPLPPINEQKRIADKVSQLFSLLDSIANNID